MDLIRALGAAPPHPAAKDRETPDDRSSARQDEQEDGFDRAMDSAATSTSSAAPTEPKATAPKKDRVTSEAAFVSTEEATQAAADTEAMAELVPKITPTLGSPPERENATISKPAAVDAAPTFVAPLIDSAPDEFIAATAPAGGRVNEAAALAQRVAVFEAKPAVASHAANALIAQGNAIDASRAVAVGALHPDAANAADEDRGLITGRIKSVIATEDKTVRPDSRTKMQAVGATSVLEKAHLSRPENPAALTQASLNDALMAALKDFSSADLKSDASPVDLLQSLGKPKLALPAHDTARLSEKLDIAPQPVSPGERGPLPVADVTPQTTNAAKLEILHNQPHVAAIDTARQVIAAIRTDVRGDQLEVRLDPPDLGRVRIHFNMDRADSVTAVVTTDRSDTLDTMRRHAGDLARELARAGFVNVQLEFKSGGERSQNGAAPQSRISGGQADEQPAEPASFVYARVRLDGRLDRLV